MLIGAAACPFTSPKNSIAIEYFLGITIFINLFDELDAMNIETTTKTPDILDAEGRRIGIPTYINKIKNSK